MTHHNHSIEERFIGTRKSLAAKRKFGDACRIIANANGCTGCYARTDAVVKRPMTDDEAAQYHARVQMARVRRKMEIALRDAVTIAECEAVARYARVVGDSRLREAANGRRREIAAQSQEMQRLGCLYRLYHSGLSSLARRQIDAAVRHGAKTIPALRAFVAARAGADTCRGRACREILAATA